MINDNFNYVDISILYNALKSKQPRTKMTTQQACSSSSVYTHTHTYIHSECICVCNQSGTAATDATSLNRLGLQIQTELLNTSNIFGQMKFGKHLLVFGKSNKKCFLFKPQIHQLEKKACIVAYF